MGIHYFQKLKVFRNLDLHSNITRDHRVKNHHMIFWENEICVNLYVHNMDFFSFTRIKICAWEYNF